MTDSLGQSREMDEHLALASECPTQLTADTPRERFDSNLFQKSKREDAFLEEQFELQL